MRIGVFLIALLAVSDSAAQPMPWMDPCRTTEACRDKGRCTSFDGECTVGGDFDCRAARVCVEEGLCFFNDDEDECDDGGRRANTGMVAGGAVLVGVGGGTILAGVVALLWRYILVDNCSSDSTGSCAKEQHESEIAAGVLIGGGAAIAFGAGLPLLVIGNRRVPRNPPPMDVRLELAPGAAVFRGSF